ncbi:MAG: hypothetical protein WA144_01905 [Candidatus Methanoperedens sp.]
MKKSEEKNNERINSDINGRIEYIDQSLRSVDNRMRAVEKRLSVKTFEPDADISSQENEISVDDSWQYEIIEKLQEINRKLANLEKTTHETHVIDIGSIKSQLSLIENRILKLEKHNEITIGKIKVPIEFSGLAATIVMFATGFLIYTGHWNIIRSSYYPISIGILFGVVVAGKFIMTNRE